MDNDITGQAQRAVGDTFQWRVLELERWREDHEQRIRKVETGMATMNERASGMDKKLDEVLTIMREHQQSSDTDTRGKLANYFTVGITVFTIVMAAILQHFWK